MQGKYGDYFGEILDLTKQLVEIPSPNSSGEGEKKMACFIEEYIRKMPYFQKYPERVIIQKLKDDKYDRRNVFALLTGEKEDCPDTILCHGHIDTVNVEDYGALSSYAFTPDKLMEKLAEVNLSREVYEDLISGDYLFGRGTCDMKGGDAVFLVLIRHLSQHIEEFGGNILLSFNPVEENLHTGMIEGLDILEQLRDKYHLKYLFAINNDYICPLYPGDQARYVYMGAVGKLLPCFYIQGKETHVGQCFEGFDASLVAAELVRIISLNCDFCEEYKGEYTLPPSVLKMKDLKSDYNVQTAIASFVYFNYFVYNLSISEIVTKLKDAAKQALDNVQIKINKQYKTYCSISNMKYEEFAYSLKVLDYEELYDLAALKYKGDIKSLLTKKTENLLQNGMDKREIPLKLTQKLCSMADIKSPVIILFFAAPYCPHTTVHEEDSIQKNLYRQLKEIITEFAQASQETYEIKQFFPSLSDSSYLSMDDDDDSIRSLIKNFPEFSILYPMPLEKIKRLNIPAINYGCFGKDAHKWTERVYMPYSFGVLPQFIQHTFEKFLKFKK